jgi:hypothetical protein
MACVLLPQLAVIISAHRKRSSHILVILGHTDSVIVRTGDIYDILFSE